MTGVRQDHTTSNFGAYSRKVIDTINAMPERERCFPLMVKWTGFRSVALPVAHAARGSGRSGYSFSRLWRLAIGIVLSYSDKRSEEHTSELQSLMRISYAVLCLKKQKK